MDPQPEPNPDRAPELQPELQRPSLTPEISPNFERLAGPEDSGGGDRPGGAEPDKKEPAPPRKSLPRWAGIGAALVLLAGAMLLWTGLDVKKTTPPPASVQQVVVEEIVVDLRDNVTDAEIAALNSQFGISLRYNSIHSHKAKLMVATVEPARSAAILTGLRASKLVEAADPNYLRQPFAAPTWKPDDPFYSQQWHLKMLRLEEAWVYTKGEGAVVAIIDTGTGLNDPRVWRRLKDFDSTKFVKPYDFVGKDDIPEDVNGHGTHVAGTVAESTNNGVMGAGVAPGAAIMALRVIGQRGGADSDIADAIRYAADNGANVINMSLGGPYPNQVLELAVQYAYQKNVTLVAATGNDGRQGVNYPARLQECIAVSAVDPAQKLTRYSTWGQEVDIAAPGGDTSTAPANGIWQNTLQPQGGGGLFGGPGQLVEGFYAKQGTSMAAPHVAGVAALLVSAGVKTPDEIRSLLRRSATNLGPEEQYGAGLVDAAEALKATGRSPYEKYYIWGAIAFGAIVLLAFTGAQHFVMGALFLLAGYYLPQLVEKKMGFGSMWNLAGHSVIVPVLWLFAAQLGRSSLAAVSGLTLGLAVHFGLDLRAGASPIPVKTQSRLALWFFLNLTVAMTLILASSIRLGGKGKTHG